MNLREPENPPKSELLFFLKKTDAKIFLLNDAKFFF
jgi:hypothetical protein